MAKPTGKQSIVGLALAILTFATSYLGYDKYEQSQIIVQPSEVNVAITSMPSGVQHIHRSTENIQALINKAVEAKMNHHINKSGRH